jgi:hypothetical protein
MSKRTSYGKIYRPDIHFVRMSASIVRTSARIHVYPTNAFLSTDGFLMSMPTVKNASVQTHQCVHADVARMRWCIRADQLPPTPLPPSLARSLPPLCPNGWATSTRTRVRPRGCLKNKIKIVYEFGISLFTYTIKGYSRVFFKNK